MPYIGIRVPNMVHEGPGTVPLDKMEGALMQAAVCLCI